MGNLRNKLHENLIYKKTNYATSIRQIFASYKDRIEDANNDFGVYDKDFLSDLGDDYKDFLFYKYQRDFYKFLIRYFEEEIFYLICTTYEYDNDFDTKNQSIFILLKTHIQLKIIMTFINIICKWIDKKTNKQIIKF